MPVMPALAQQDHNHMEIENFVKSYTEDDLLKIMFDWNGKHADGFEDHNIEFRRCVLEYFKEHMSSFPIQLIVDLYEAETQLAKEAWGVNPIVSDLAQELLERGRAKYVVEYLKGLGRGMDAHIQAKKVELTDECLNELINYCENNRSTGVFQNEGQLDILIEFFQWKLQEKR